MINLGREICTDFEGSTSREWLETNGIGGFASGTISGSLTRRYHALLTAATQPPLGRVTMLSKFEETLVIDGARFELSSNKYPGMIYPEGYKYLSGFRLEPFPIWAYEVESVQLEKRVFMLHRENAVVVRYSLQGKKTDLKLELRPLLSFVDYHHLQHETPEFNGEFETRPGFVSVQPYAELPILLFNHNGSAIEKSGFWYRNFEYEIERERGFDYTGDLFQPFVMTFDLATDATVIASTEIKNVNDVSKFEKSEIDRRNDLIKTAKTSDEFKQQLVLAADQFIVARGKGQTVIAGYPWFSDWGRDTMIALPGLTLSTNRPEIAKGILLEFSNHISNGMLPNRFADADGEAEYNTVDATLWFFEAIRAYTEKTDDYDFIEMAIYEKLADIVAWHLRGNALQHSR
jgi:predicted glycogen debranching enzyme